METRPYVFYVILSPFVILNEVKNLSMNEVQDVEMGKILRAMPSG